MSTKALLDSQYEFSGEPDGHPNTRPGVRLHYVRKCMEPIIHGRLDRVVEYFGLDSSSRVLIIGTAFGWGVEYLASVCTCVGTEIDPYFFTEGPDSDEAEIRACVEAAGLDSYSGRGLELMQRWCTAGPRMASNNLLQEDSLSEASRSVVTSALGGTPHLVIVEDVIAGLPLDEAAAVVSAAESYGAPVCYTGAMTDAYQIMIGDSLVFNGRGVA